MELRYPCSAVAAVVYRPLKENVKLMVDMVALHGPECSTRNSRILMKRNPKGGTPIFRKLPDLLCILLIREFDDDDLQLVHYQASNDPKLAVVGLTNELFHPALWLHIIIAAQKPDSYFVEALVPSSRNPKPLNRTQ